MQVNNTPNLLYNFLFEYRLSYNQIIFGEAKTGKSRKLFALDKKRNLLIYYPTLEGNLHQWNNQGKETLTARKRLAMPYENREGDTVKYLMAGKNTIYFPPQMVKAYQRGTVIETLIVTEGEKKAFVAAANGFDCVGISGIWNFCKKPDNGDISHGPLMPELVEFLKRCGVKRVVLLHDSDALDISRNPQKSATERPSHFFNATKRFAELIIQEGVRFFHSYINPHLCEEKLGLDDLIRDFENYDQRVLLDFYESVETASKKTYFCTTQIASIQSSFIKGIFQLNDPEEFYNYHKKALAGQKEFRFDKRAFSINHAEGKITEIKKTERDQVWIKDGCYYAYDIKGNPRLVSNFVMRVLFLLKSSTNAKRIIEFENVLGQSFVKEFTMDDLVSVSAFRKKLIGDGSFIYKGDMIEFLNLQELYFRGEQTATELTSLGWQKNYSFFAFSNGITSEGKFFPVNEYGIVNHHDQKFYLPAFSSLYNDADEHLENERNFRHIEHEADFQHWATLFYKCYKNNGAIGIAFYMAALFRDIIFGEFKEFPLLDLFGQKGSGKSTMAKSLMYLFGVPQNAISLENASSTKKGIYRKFAQYRNAFVWLDEYKNAIHPDLIGLLKNLYDGIGYERAQTSNDNRTTGNPVLCSAILSGQDMPTIDPALFTRVILLMFKNNEFKEEDRQAYNDLKAYEKKGLSMITVQMLENRQLIAENFLQAFKFWFDKLSKEFKYDDIPDRMIKNAAMLLAPAALIHTKGQAKLPFSELELYAKFVEVLKAHKVLLNDNQEISVFWDIVESLFIEKVLTFENNDFRFINDTVAIRFNRVYNAYSEKYRKIHGRQALDKLTITNYLKNSPAFVEMADSVRFHSTNTSAYIFKYKQLGINLNEESAETKTQPAQSEIKLPEGNPIIENNNNDLPY